MFVQVKVNSVKEKFRNKKKKLQMQNRDAN